MDLIPPALIVAHYFADSQVAIGELTVAAEEATRAVEEYVEEHAVEDGLLADAMDVERRRPDRHAQYLAGMADRLTRPQVPWLGFRHRSR